MPEDSSDRTDFEIVRLLQKNARLSNKQVAAAVCLAPSTCHERIKRLFDLGILRGAHAEVDLGAIGLKLEALIFLKLAKYEKSVIDRFLRNIQSIPEVRQVFLVSGRHDAIVHVAVRDIDHLRTFGFGHITNLPLIVNIETSIVFDGRTNYELPIPAEIAPPKKSFSPLVKSAPPRFPLIRFATHSLSPRPLPSHGVSGTLPLRLADKFAYPVSLGRYSINREVRFR
jgi:DNA-binding Lrp family transcriptional regulator